MSLAVAVYFGIIVHVATLPVDLATCALQLQSQHAHMSEMISNAGGNPDGLRVMCVPPGAVVLLGEET